MPNSLRVIGVTCLLLGSAGPAFAIDQSTMEETNCLMACDTNQQNCHAPGSASIRRNASRAAYSSPQRGRASSAISAAYEAASRPGERK